MSPIPKTEREREEAKALFGDHASGRYGDQAYGRIEAGGDAGAGGDGGTNAQVVAGTPASTARGSEDELDSPGISTDKRSDDTKPTGV